MSTTLLAVDDSATMRKVLEITFSGEEFRVVTADSPDAALKKARSERPGLILLDVTLPGQDGYALCKTFKAEMPNVPILILSSKQGPYDAAKGSAAGADEFADKPFDTQQIIDKVKRVLAAKGAGAGAAAAPAPAATPAAAQRPGAGTIPGSAPAAATPPPVPAQAGGGRAPQTQTFGSSGSPSRSTQPGAAPPPATASGASGAVRSGATTLGIQPGVAPTATAAAAPADNRTRTASGLGSAAAQAQATTQNTSKLTQPALPAQLRGAAGTAGSADSAPAAAAPAAAAPAAAAPSPVATAIDGQLSGKLAEIGLTSAQVDAVLALSREVVERVVWEVVPVLAETIIKEEIRRLTSES